jgi:polar amino acid transport system permease protein
MPSKYGHLPWYRRYWFVIGFFVLYGAYAATFMPPAGGLGALGIIELIVTTLIYIAVLVVVQTDLEKPNWLKNLYALGLVAALAWLFVRYSGAEWGLMAENFFDFSIMSKGDFMSDTASRTNWQLMFNGLWVAVQIFAYSMVIATVLGLIIAVIRSLVNDAVLNVAIDAYIDVFRAVPPIALLLVVYASLPYSGIVLSPFMTGVVVLSLIEGAYLSEVFRSGIESIHKTQTESARALGLSALQAMRLVVIPQALRTVMPPYSNRMVGLMKRTAECSVIAIPEILSSARQIQSWYANTTPLTIAAAMYLLVLLPLTKLATVLERSRQEI